MKLKILKRMLSLAMAVLAAIPMISYSASNLVASAEDYTPVAIGSLLNNCFPDPAFEGYVYCNILKKHAPEPINYALTAEDVKAIKTAKKITLCNTATLYDLSGIQNFDSLEELDCSYTSITNLDLSQNTKLRVLNCSSLDITSLNLSKNTKLNDLNCSYNGIYSLDLSQNTELNILNCSHTSLKKLDLSKNKKLTNFSCQYTNITDLDVSNNKELSYILVD